MTAPAKSSSANASPGATADGAGPSGASGPAGTATAGDTRLSRPSRLSRLPWPSWLPGARRGRGGLLAAPASGVGLLLLSIISLQSGTAFAKLLFSSAGVVGITFLRNAFSTLVLWVAARPEVRGYTRRHWGYAATLGVTTAAMNLAFYASAERIPIGVAVAIDFLGPITVAIINTRHRRQALWPLLAYGGVLLLTPLGSVTSLDVLGVVFALCAALGWGLYIVLTARTSALFGQTAGLTLATTFGTLALLPLLFFVDTGGLAQPSTLLLGFVVAMVSTAVPFTIEFKLLSRMPERVFGVLLSMEPAVAAVIGLVVLGETLGGWEWMAIALIVCAAAGVAWRPAEPAPNQSVTSGGGDTVGDQLSD